MQADTYFRSRGQRATGINSEMPIYIYVSWRVPAVPAPPATVKIYLGCLVSDADEYIYR